MPTLRELTETIRTTPGVHAAVVLGDDGLVIEASETAGGSAELLAARVPGMQRSAQQLGEAAGLDGARLSLVEFSQGYSVTLTLSEHAVLLVTADREVDLARLLFDLRRYRSDMAALV